LNSLLQERLLEELPEVQVDFLWRLKPSVDQEPQTSCVVPGPAAASRPTQHF